MTIKVYPSTMQGEPIETYEWAGTFADWLKSKDIKIDEGDQRSSIKLNGNVFPYADWGTYEIKPNDNLEIRFLPQGGAFLIGAIIAAVTVVASIIFRPRVNAPNARSNAPRGRSLEASQGAANTPQMGEVVPELAGKFKRFPDYVTQPRRYFANPRDQRLEFHACIGPGSYYIDPDDVKIGDTSFSSLDGGGEFQIFSPGEDVSGVSSHEHWHTVREIGDTSSGTAGLELSTEYANRVNADPASYSFNGNEIMRSEGNFPSGWGNGTLIDVTISDTKAYAVTQPSTNPLFPLPNVFTGDFKHLMPLSNGTQINISGAISGDFFVEDVSLDANGQGSLELWHFVPGEQTGPGEEPVFEYVPVNDLAPNNYTLTTSRTRQLTVSSVGEGSLTVDSGGYPEFSSVAIIAFAGGTVYGEWTNEYTANPSDESTSTLEFDFFFPGGLARIGDEGDVLTRSIGVEFQYRYLDTNQRITVRRTYTQRSLDQIGFTERIDIASGRVACRARRVGAQGISTQIRDVVQWYGLKCRLPTVTSYPNWTTISVLLKSGGKIASRSENQINVIATRILPTLQPNGAWGAPEPTRDISAFLRHIAKTIGYTDANLDMDELQSLHDLWTSRGEAADYVFDETTVKDAMNVVLGAGMAELTISDGQIRPVREGPRTQFEGAYSPQNMIGSFKRTFKARRHDDPDGVEVEYTDSNTWTQQTVICALPDSPRFKLEKLKLKGVTNRTRAWRIGMRRARQQRFNNWDYQFETELDALNSEYLSYVALFDDIPGYGQPTLLEHITPDGDDVILHVSEPIQWQEGENHVVAYRKPDGSLAGPWLAFKGVDEYSIKTSIPLSQRPSVSLKMELPHVFVGTIERWCFPAIINEISPRGFESVAVRATNYSEQIYADDNNSAPN